MADIRATILDAQDLESEFLEIPEWGVTVEVRGMTARDRSSLQRKIAQKDGPDLEAWYWELALSCVYDPETGKRVFDKADRDVILGKSALVLSRIADVATRLSGMGVGSVEEAQQELGETGS